jgi:hypothetical protein
MLQLKTGSLMTPSSFDNIFSKFKESTKHAADQMSKAAKAAKLRMEIMTLSGEKTRHLQTIGVRAYNIYKDNRNLEGAKSLSVEKLYEQTKAELVQIERIDERIDDLEKQIITINSQDDPNTVDASEVKETFSEDSEQS